MKFCSTCGSVLVSRIPEGDNRLRHCCTNCGEIHYENPKIVVGTVPVWDGFVLLCRRAIEPRRGYWTLPAGFLENDETTYAGALRETTEEAGARVELGPLFTVLDVVHVHQVHMFYQARLVDLEFAPGIESLEVKLFRESEVPWEEVAFRTVTQTLEHYFTDRITGSFQVHVGAISWTPQGVRRREDQPLTTRES